MRWRDAAVWAMAAGLAACDGGGYPTEDAPRFDPFAMDRSELLKQLNRLGREADGARWRYRIDDDCALVVQRATVQHTLPLPAQELTLRFDREATLWDVVDGEAAVFRGPERRDAMRAQLLVQVMGARCHAEREEAAPAA